MNPNRLNEIIKIIAKSYPNPKTTLNYNNAFQFLIAIILSARCTDLQLNKVTSKLFLKYKTPKDYAEAEFENIANMIKSLGLYKSKARNIINASQILRERFKGKVPNSFNKLLQLPGVGRKTVNVIMAEYFNRSEGIIVDTHVARVSGRLGFTNNIKPLTIENDLMRILPKENWIDFPRQLIFHGRYICKSGKPLCQQCLIKKYCKHYKGSIKVDIK
jgi:endonuclease-3